MRPTEPPAKLLVFDVDGTLTYSGGLTRVAMEIVMNELYGVPNAAEAVKPHGQTDQVIFRNLLALNGLSDRDFDQQFDVFTERYIVELKRLLESVDGSRVRLLAGVQDLLRKASIEKGMHLALGTGNVARAAFLKLNRHGVAHYFPTGGFGSDSEDRRELLRIAVKRARDYYVRQFPMEDVWIIGDTPNDVACGRDIGAATLAVATGIYGVEELERCEPTAALTDLADTDEVIRLLWNGGDSGDFG